MVTALGAVQEVQRELLVFGRGLGDLLGCRVHVGVADASFFAEVGDAKAEKRCEEEGSRCGEEDIALVFS